MATTKLKNLKVTKVDFVDEGANPDAHIKLFKSKGADDGAAETIDTPGEPAGAQESGILGWLTAIGKKLGIQKDAQTFGEKVTEVELSKIAEEMWSMCAALAESLRSILYDDDMDGAKADSMMQLSLSQFNETMGKAIGSWANGKTSEIKKAQNLDGYSLEMLEKTRDQLQEYIQKAREEVEIKGGLEEMMKIDKSKMSPEDLEAYNSIIEKYAVDEGEEEHVGKSTTVGKASKANSNTPDDPDDDPDVIDDDPEQKKACGGKKTTKKSISGGENEGEDIFKGLSEEARKEIESLRKFRQEYEDREIRAVAKRYEIIGKKEEDLFPLLKGLKAAGGSLYDDMIAMLDETKATVEKSGIFGEVGKSGHGAPGADSGSAWAEAETKAVELMKSRTGLTKAQALDSVFQDDPVLAKRCEEEE